MAYRDETAAARAHLATLEHQLAARRAAARSLRGYRDALRDEARRLAHAVAWYHNGARHGFNRFVERDDLGSTSEELQAPPVEVVPRPPTHAATVDAREAVARAATLARELAFADSTLSPLRADVGRLRGRCDRLRTLVARFAERFPDHPPPPAYRPSYGMAIALAGASFASAVALLIVLLLLAAL